MKILFSRNTRARFNKGIKNFFTDYLTIALLILSFIMLISILYSADKKIAINESARFISYVVLFFILKYELQDKRTINNIIKTYIFVCFLVFSIGIIKNVTTIRLESTLENSNNLAAFAIFINFPFHRFMYRAKGNYKKNGIPYYIYIRLNKYNIIRVEKFFNMERPRGVVNAP